MERESGSSTLETDEQRPVVVIGVGVSAESIESFQSILDDIPTGRRIAIIAIVDSTYRGEFPSKLGPATAPYRVHIVESNTRLKSDAVYIATSTTDRILTLRNGQLTIESSSAANRATPINFFFATLAQDQKRRAVGLLLSGAGADGIEGLKAINDSGGMTIVETHDRRSTRKSDLEAGPDSTVDRYLHRNAIADELVNYVEYVAAQMDQESDRRLTERIIQAIPAIADAVERYTERDIKHYKTTTLVRRIRRRMQVNTISSVSTYVDWLNSSRDECRRLFQDLLISVTAFFRDREAFEALNENVIVKLVRDCPPEGSVRVWIPGCATGEEAYSLAILFREAMRQTNRTVSVQIFATDLDEQALSVARLGNYPIGIQNELSPERLQRFFVRRGDRFQATREIRDLLIFSTQDLISGSPFSNLDLISCRNLLIYLGSHLQKKLIPLFHFALRPNGYLFMGPSESPAAHQELFRVIDEKSRIAQRKSTTLSVAHSNLPVRSVRSEGGDHPPVSADVDLHKIGQKIVLDEFGPQWAIVTDDSEILSLSSDLSPFLKLQGGTFENNVIQMARAGLKIGLRSALNEAKRNMRRVVRDGLSMRTRGGIQRVSVTVQPMPQFGEERKLYFVAFQRLGDPIARHVQQPRPNAAGAPTTALTTNCWTSWNGNWRPRATTWSGPWMIWNGPIMN